MVVPQVQVVVARGQYLKIMKKIIQIFVVVLCMSMSFAQEQNQAFRVMVDTTIQKTVPLISVAELKAKYNDFVILDSREKKEFQTSHLKNATCVGYNNFKLKKTIQQLDKSKPIVVYCSIGYRSEKIAEKLQQKGFKVYNLYGGIFDWKNKDNTVLNQQEQPTEKVHTYNEDWSQWLVKGEKIYPKTKPKANSK